MKKPLLAILACVLMTACAKNYVKSSTAVNPPPTEAFAAFDRFELKPVTLAPQYSTQPENKTAAIWIQAYFDEQVKPMVDNWNASGKSGGRTLVIEPVVEQIQFVGAEKRIFASLFSGGSAVVMKVKYTDPANGRTIAHPEFYQHASAVSGTLTYGMQDYAMLPRIVTLVADYSRKNHDAPVGGPTGMPEDMLEQ